MSSEYDYKQGVPGGDKRISRIHRIGKISGYFTNDVSPTAVFDRSTHSLEEIPDGLLLDTDGKISNKNVSIQEIFGSTFGKYIDCTDIVSYNYGNQSILSISDNKGLDICIVSLKFDDMKIYMSTKLEKTKDSFTRIKKAYELLKTESEGFLQKN